jgi:CHAD domain-containing protein
VDVHEQSNTEEGQGAKPLARTQKELLNLHDALIREAKLQGIAKYQVRTLRAFDNVHLGEESDGAPFKSDQQHNT